MSFTRRVRRLVELVRGNLRDSEYRLQLASDAEIRALEAEMRAATPDNPALSGYRVFSQFDEDGVIEEIFRRLGRGETFLEIGCGDGRENNTHYLLLKGWRGTWVDGGAHHVAAIQRALPTTDRLRVLHRFIDQDNVAELAEPVDFLSLDIDGNDLHVLKAFVARAKPRVICVEYNAIFPPPMEISVRYNPKHHWGGNDYFGASLATFVSALPGYRLVACSLNGTNAFFVQEGEAAPFTAYTPEQLYQPARYHLTRTRRAHPSSFRFLADALAPPA